MPLRNSQCKCGHFDCFSTLACSCYGPNSTRNSRKMCTCHIYAFLLKGWGRGVLLLVKSFFFFFSRVLFPLFLSGFRNKLQFCMDFLNVHFETNDQIFSEIHE